MLLFVADENFNNDIVRGVQRSSPAADIIRVQDVGLSGADDPAILEWAAQSGRVVLTHDVATMTKYAYERVRARKSMPGVFEIARSCRYRHRGNYAPHGMQSRRRMGGPSPVSPVAVTRCCPQWRV